MNLIEIAKSDNITISILPGQLLLNSYYNKTVKNIMENITVVKIGMSMS